MGYSPWGHKSQTQLSDRTTTTHFLMVFISCVPSQYSMVNLAPLL